MAQKIIKIDGKTFVVKSEIKDFDDFKKKFSYVYEPIMKRDFEKIMSAMNESSVSSIAERFVYEMFGSVVESFSGDVKRLEDKISDMISDLFYKNEDEFKQNYTQWFYGKGGVQEKIAELIKLLKK